MNQIYFTIEEMARKWSIPARRIQYLCKQGRIAGAQKKAGVWFIPEESQILPSARDGEGQAYAFTGTKKELFEGAVKLFMQRGYETVSIRDITNEVGIRQSAAYYHFKSKQQILDSIYAFYLSYVNANSPSMRDLEPILRQGSLADIIKSVCFLFDGSQKQMLMDITRIIFQRCAIDETAGQIAKSLIVDESIAYAEELFEKAIAMGRIAPLDVHALAVCVSSLRMYTLLNWITDDSPENMEKTRADENSVLSYALRLITDLWATSGEPRPPEFEEVVSEPIIDNG